MNLTTSIRGGNSPLLVEIPYPMTEDGTRVHPSLLEALSAYSEFRIPICFCDEEVEITDKYAPTYLHQTIALTDDFINDTPVNLTAIYTHPSAICKYYESLEEDCSESFWQSYQLCDTENSELSTDTDSDRSFDCDGDYPDEESDDGYASSTDSIHDFIVPDNFIEWESDSDVDSEDDTFNDDPQRHQLKRRRALEDSDVESSAQNSITRPEKRLRIAGTD
ncbi:hypothetical protein BKA70DRAFT_1450087 [Coprinopsis sp. MPI-PUGE-AT-0042]|nr:hypothetical protein BKA70DRAFT_1450087 [Coprinopsis sp. MPI-PUGE-AT-0042]